MASPLQECSSHSFLLVEPDSLQSTTLAKMLSNEYPRLSLYQAYDSETALRLFREHAPEVVLVDLAAPALDCLDVLRDILAESPLTQAIAIGDQAGILLLQLAVRLGARQFLLKPLDRTAVCEAVAESLKRVELEQQVKSQEEYRRTFARAVEQSPAVIVFADADGNIVCINRRYRELTGYREEEVLGKPLRVICGETPEEFTTLWKELSCTGADAEEAGSVFSADLECLVLRRDRSPLPCLVSAAPVRDQEDGRFLGASIMLTDISTRKRIQDQSLRTQKLESLGVLAGGIAHDFNNVLTGVLGNISFAQALAGEDHLVSTPLRDAEEASLRAAELARQLLTFARGGKPIKKRVLVRQLLEDAVSLALSGSKVAAAVKLADDVHALEVDEGLVTQAFSNILINAAQAMPCGGSVTVEAKNLRLGRRNPLGVPAGHYVRISFKDEGAGIPEAVQRKIFDPYFSTKPGSSGLGLASAYTIVMNHGGHIDVRSRVGKGATIICHLPSGGDNPAPAARPEVVLAGVGGNAAVLIMDDEHIVRKVATKMLESLGYQVTACVNGEQAIELYLEARRAERPYLAVLMDLTIPAGMGGKEAAQAILAVDPDARLVVSSGYFDDPVMSDYRDYGFCAVMPKPYKLAELARLMGKLSGGTSQ